MTDTPMLWSQLEDSDFDVRWKASRKLSKLDPATLAQHADAVAARLEDCHVGVRQWAIRTLCTLDPATLAQHAGAVIARLEDIDSHRSP